MSQSMTQRDGQNETKRRLAFTLAGAAIFVAVVVLLFLSLL